MPVFITFLAMNYSWTMFAVAGSKSLDNSPVESNNLACKNRVADEDVSDTCTDNGSSSETSMSCEEQLQRNIARRRKSQAWPYGSGLSPKKVAQLQAIGRDSSVQVRGHLDKLCSESTGYLERLAREVREGKALHEANNFARWLQFSGVLALLEMFSDVNPEFGLLRRKASDLSLACGERFKGGKMDAQYSSSDISQINSKLDFLLSAFAKPASPVIEHAIDASQVP